MASPKIRQITVAGNVAYVPLTKGFQAIIDAADAPLIAAFTWSTKLGRHTVYSRRNDQSGGKQVNVLLHRFLLGAPEGAQVDHINGDGLDNRRANLRLASHAENLRNRRLNANSASGLKGVYWHKSSGRWAAQIQANGQRKRLGFFDTPEAAHAAYCAAAQIHHGEFARTGD